MNLSDIYMDGLCKYAKALGRPHEGFHAPRFYGVAVLDVVGTIGLAWILQVITEWTFSVCLVIMFLFGIVCHRLFCVKTTIDIALFGAKK